MSRSKPRKNRKPSPILLKATIHDPQDPEHLRVCKTCSATEYYERPMATIEIVETLPEAFEAAVKEIKGYKPLILGLDTKTQLNSDKVSVITLAVPGTKTYIFQVRKIWDTYQELPPGLIKLLQTPHIIKVTFDPTSRAEQLFDYEVRLDGIIDIRSIARIRGHDKTGIDALTGELFKGAYYRHKHWRKRKEFITANWNKEVTRNMSEYTASRANLCSVIYTALCEEPVTPFKELL